MTATLPGPDERKNAQIDTISPPSGTELGGDHVTLHGSGLGPTTSVMFGPNEGTGIYIPNDSTVVVVSPAGEGVVDVTVNGGNGSDTMAGAFTYVPVPEPPDPESLPLFEFTSLNASTNGANWWASGTLSDAEQDVSDWVGQDIALMVNGSRMVFTINSGTVPGPNQPHIWQATDWKAAPINPPPAWMR